MPKPALADFAVFHEIISHASILLPQNSSTFKIGCYKNSGNLSLFLADLR
jgi:hypothetical protein